MKEQCGIRQDFILEEYSVITQQEWDALVRRLVLIGKIKNKEVKTDG